MVEAYSVRVYRLGLSRHLRAEVIRDGMVIAWASYQRGGAPQRGGRPCSPVGSIAGLPNAGTRRHAARCERRR